jgi:copper transporter 1
MLFTWSTENLCIVFRSWRITNTFTLFLSLFLIVVLCAGYEAVREVSRRYEASCTAKLQNIPSKLPPLPLCTIEEETVLVQTVDVRQCDAEEAIVAEGQDDKLKTIFLPLWHKGPGHEISESSSLLRLGNQVPQAQRSSEMVKAALYAVQVFYSFFIM